METSIAKRDNQQLGLMHSNFMEPQSFDEAQRMAKALAMSELVPDKYKVSPTNPIEKAVSNCIIALDYAQRLKLSPFVVMQNLSIIQGRPSLSSAAIIACVKSCREFEQLEFDLKVEGTVGNVTYNEVGYNNGKKVLVPKQFENPDLPNYTCVAYTKRIGSDKILYGTKVTMKMAIAEGWYTKSGSKWQTMPQLMLQYRAAAFWARVYAPDKIMGMQTTEEVRDTLRPTEIPPMDIAEVEVVDLGAEFAQEQEAAVDTTVSEASETTEQ